MGRTEDWYYNGYGCMGRVNDSYILFATVEEYYDYLEDYSNE